MNLVLLPGNSKAANEKWIKDVAESVKDSFDSTYIHTYQHWFLGGSIDLENELKRLSESIKNLDDYVVFAKSAGAILTYMAVERDILHPKKCIFIGTAIAFAKSLSLSPENLVQKFSIPTLYIQKTADPAYSFNDLKSFLMDMKAKNYELIELPGSDHDYNDINKLRDLIVGFKNGK